MKLSAGQAVQTVTAGDEQFSPGTLVNREHTATRHAAGFQGAGMCSRKEHEAMILKSDPHPARTILMHGVRLVARKSFRLSVNSKKIVVQTRQAAAGSDPQIAFANLENAADQSERGHSLDISTGACLCPKPRQPTVVASPKIAVPVELERTGKAKEPGQRFPRKSLDRSR